MEGCKLDDQRHLQPDGKSTPEGSVSIAALEAHGFSIKALMVDSRIDARRRHFG